ncbi:MAG: hypothetical protein H9Q67_05870 [Spiroplasma ixodetis]|nr:hypothetical protein [Spiroplasma ixodetis]
MPENIERYENFLNKSINIYKYDDIEITLYYQIQKLNNKEGHINLLLYKDHVVGIKNLSALLKGQIHRYTNHVNICMKCRKKFESESKYNSHIEHCVNEKQNIQMPSSNNNIRKYHYTNLVQNNIIHILLTLDFECILQKIAKQATKTTKYIHKHIANSFCFYSD